MGNLPAGTVTFLMTDIENSSEHWEASPSEMRAVLTVHDQIVTEAILTHRGCVVKHLGDGIWASFAAAPDAAQCAIDTQLRLQALPENIRARLAVRIGLHTGDVEPTGDDYFGPVPNRCARIADVANGNQLVCSSATAGLLADFRLRSQGLHELRGIGEDEVFLIDADGLEIDPRPFRRPVVPSNLPRIQTSFIGREQDVARLKSLLAEGHTVVTMIGPGGVGKTRLAIEVGTDTARSSGRTVVFSDLAALSDDDDVAAAVADVVGARQQGGMSLLDSIADYLGARDVLLILDNCEHVIDAVRSLVLVLEKAEGVDVLATSRAALGLGGEQLLTLEPLGASGAAVELFVSRAQQHDPKFALTPANTAAINEITARLDGIPLAIELAAAKIRLMTPQELVAGLEDRFRLLGGVDRRHRHETLYEIVQWSYQLLSEKEAAVYRRLSVFTGGATLEAIASVCGDHGDDELAITAAEIPDLVLALLDRSMIVSRTSDSHRRFAMLETLREFADQELQASGAQDTYRLRHAKYFRGLAAAQNERLFTAAEHDVWRVLDDEWSNLRTSLDTYQARTDIDSGAELVISLVWYATLAMRFELFSWADELLEFGGIEAHPSYTDLCGAGALGAYVTVTGQGKTLAEAGLQANEADPQGFCRTALAAVFLNNVHTLEASGTLTEEWLASEPTTVGGRLWAEAFRTFHLFSSAAAAEAAQHAAATSAIAHDTGSATAQGLAAWAQGMVLAFTDRDASLDVWNEGLEWPRSMPRSSLVEQLLVGLILNFTVRHEDAGAALKHCRDALVSALDEHYYAGLSHLFGVTAIVLCRVEDAKTGARLVGAMIGNGHLPRGNAIRALDDALGESVEAYKTAGLSLSVDAAGRLAIDAIDAAIGRIATTPA